MSNFDISLTGRVLEISRRWYPVKVNIFTKEIGSQGRSQHGATLGTWYNVGYVDTEALQENLWVLKLIRQSVKPSLLTFFQRPLRGNLFKIIQYRDAVHKTDTTLHLSFDEWFCRGPPGFGVGHYDIIELESGCLALSKVVHINSNIE